MDQVRTSSSMTTLAVLGLVCSTKTQPGQTTPATTSRFSWLSSPPKAACLASFRSRCSRTLTKVRSSATVSPFAWVTSAVDAPTRLPRTTTPRRCTTTDLASLTLQVAPTLKRATTMQTRRLTTALASNSIALATAAAMPRLTFVAYVTDPAPYWTADVLTSLKAIAIAMATKKTPLVCAAVTAPKTPTATAFATTKNKVVRTKLPATTTALLPLTMVLA